MSTLRIIRFRLALWFWTKLLPLLAWRGRSLSSLLALAKPRDTTPYSGIPADYIINRVKKATKRPVVMSDRPCLREGILAHRFLRLAGYEPTLHFGLDRESIARSALSAHCWVVLGRKIVLNPPTPSMMEILVYANDGLIQPASLTNSAALE